MKSNSYESKMNCCGFSQKNQKKVRVQVKYGVIQRYATKYPMFLCAIFLGYPAVYYSFLKRRKQPTRESVLLQRIQACHDSRKYMCTYGCHRAQLWLERQHGEYYNSKTVWRIMHKYGLLSKIRRKRFFHYGEEIRTYENLLHRNFHADRPNEKWVTDISYISTKQGNCLPFHHP